MMTREEIINELSTLSKRIYDLSKQLDEYMVSLHESSVNTCEELNDAVLEIADFVIKGGE